MKFSSFKIYSRARFASYEKFIDPLIAMIEDMDFSLIFFAISIIFTGKSFSEKILLTKPALSASCASIYLPLNAYPLL